MHKHASPLSSKRNYAVTVETESTTGAILAAYFRLRKGKSAEVREFAEGAALADYGKQGELLGVEFLAPCKVSVLDQIAKDEPFAVRAGAKHFVRNTAPRAMLAKG